MSIEQIDVETLRSLGPDARIIDVREPDEWAGGHIPYAEHVPLRTVPGELARFDGAPTYVICRSGGRSMQACEFVASHGHPVVNVAGGMLAWVAAGHETVGGAGG